MARYVDRNRVVVAHVLGEDLAGLAVEDDDAHHAGDTDEEIVLAALVIVQAADDSLLRAREIRLHDRFRQRTRADELGEPAPVVLVLRQRETCDDHLLTPLRRTKSLTW